MIITPYFVFLHVPKTGGRWVKSTIPDEWCLQRLREHESRAAVPDEYADLPVLAFVRNPWDWYVSHYSFHLSNEPRSPRADLLFANGESFDSFLHTALEGTEFPFDARRRIANQKIDYYTVVFDNLTGSKDGIRFGRFETLREDFLRLLEESGAPVTSELREKVLTAPAENRSSHRDYRSYYTDELRDLVAERSRLMIERFGYSF